VVGGFGGAVAVSRIRGRGFVGHHRNRTCGVGKCRSGTQTPGRRAYAMLFQADCEAGHVE
jgi:hypothetical protein